MNHGPPTRHYEQVYPGWEEKLLVLVSHTAAVTGEKEKTQGTAPPRQRAGLGWVHGGEKLFPGRAWPRVPEKLWEAGVCAHVQMEQSWSLRGLQDTIPGRNSAGRKLLEHLARWPSTRGQWERGALW